MSRIAEAYGNGYDSIELIHGAGDVNEPVEEGRGRIKWELRRLASGGAKTPTLMLAPTPRQVAIVKVVCASPNGRNARSRRRAARLCSWSHGRTTQSTTLAT